MKKTELKVTSAAGVVGALPVVLDMLKGESLSENLLLAALGCVTAMVVTYNIARGIAKVEKRVLGSPSTGSKSTEFTLSAAIGGLGAMPILIDMLRGGEMLTERVKIALLLAITLIAMSYTLSRGLAITDERTDSALRR